MRIAFISYEYPPDTAVGGIATYVFQAASMLCSRGHEVEVFTASQHRDGEELCDGIRVHRLHTDDRDAFPQRIAPVFADRHQAAPFDVLEGPDLMAEAGPAAALAPDVALVVKLHTSMFMIRRIVFSTLSFRTRLRKRLGAWRRGECPAWNRDHAAHAVERQFALAADEVAAPCRAIARYCLRAWGLQSSRTTCYPYPFQPSRDLLAVPVESNCRTVTFLGRLEIRKGVIDLADAIPLVAKQCPKARFQFVGAPLLSPEPGVDMRTFLQRRLSGYESVVEFKQAVPHDRVADVYAASDICVFPSLWENFPFVCLEAMAAARGIVASSKGGMAEMLDGGVYGNLVPPRHPRAIAAAIVALLRDPVHRMAMGRAARERVLSEYAPARVAPLQEASYIRAIARHARCGERSPVASL